MPPTMTDHHGDPYRKYQHGVAHHPGEFVSLVLYDEVYQEGVK